MNNLILINEIYGPIKQGEGKSSGKNMMFIRLAGCNLACVWCDTPYTWNWIGTKFIHPEKFDPKKETTMLTPIEIFDQVKNLSPETKAIILSGGEPMLQQKNLIPLLTLLKNNGYWIEVETNGTIEPKDDFITLIDQFNCSPKLTNSGPDNPLKKREKADALTKISSLDKST